MLLRKRKPCPIGTLLDIRHIIFLKKHYLDRSGRLLFCFGQIDIAELLISFISIRLLRKDFAIALTTFSEGWRSSV